ncbi:MAG: gamma-glutamyl-gamma-aminobutyrate hydrolase family protein, partial [Bacillota bacterium]|nr:gamma-glutamyl-gamma-aminobutyrate hydrolase family protein [Bacillota bacterium]
MQKPMIGVVPLYDETKESYWMLPSYMKGIEEAGGIPVMLPLTTDKETILTLADTFDGFLFTGGQDVNPNLYGE